MSFVWFNAVLNALGKKLNYEALANLYGNSFCKDSSEIINGAYPLIKAHKVNPLMKFEDQIQIIGGDSKNGKDEDDFTNFGDLGDISWAVNFEDPEEEKGE